MHILASKPTNVFKLTSPNSLNEGAAEEKSDAVPVSHSRFFQDYNHRHTDHKDFKNHILSRALGIKTRISNLSRENENKLNALVSRIQREMNAGNFDFKTCFDECNISSNDNSVIIKNFIFYCIYLSKHNTNMDIKINWFNRPNFTSSMKNLLRAENTEEVTLEEDENGVFDPKILNYQVAVMLMMDMPALFEQNFSGIVNNAVTPDVKASGINALNNLLPQSRDVFENLLNIPQVNNANGDNSSTLVLGDADGSIGRVLLIAMQSGHITLNEVGLQNLALILNIEAECLNSRSFSAFQNNTDVFNAVNIILQNATFYKASSIKLILAGDLIYDRLSNNIISMWYLLSVLKLMGVILIKGNHDSIDHLTQIFGDKSKQAGDDALTKFFTIKNYERKIEKNIFQNCHYDEATNVFYSHHGVVYLGNRTYVTAFGLCQNVESLQHLEQIMNDLSCSFEDVLSIGGEEPVQDAEKRRALPHLTHLSEITNILLNDDVIKGNLKAMRASQSNLSQTEDVTAHNINDIMGVLGIKPNLTEFRPSDALYSPQMNLRLKLCYQ